MIDEKKQLDEKKVKISFFGGAGQVTGSNFLLEAYGSKILIDCGLFQESKESEKRNKDAFLFNPEDMDFLFVTHGHLDHIGRIPKLARDGFKGRILSTMETREISRFLLEDALKVMEYKKRDEGKEPMYSQNDITRSFELWETIPYFSDFKINDTLTATLKNAGHILGSSMVEFKFEHNKNSLVLSGDLGNWPNPLLKKTDDIFGAKYLVMESVYGDRNHEPFEKGEKIFENVVKRAIADKGTLLIPCFSVERSQVVLFELNKLVENNVIPAIPVFFDSPLAIRLTEIYKKSENLFNSRVQNLIKSGDDIFSFKNLVISKTSNESRSISDTLSPKIIIAGAGMSQGGRIVSHEARYLPDPRNSVLLLGFQAVGTLGRALKDGAKEVLIDDKKISVKARIDYIDSFSAHKDSDGLLEFVATGAETLKKVFLVMGEPKSSLFLAQRIKDYLDIECVIPEVGDSQILEF